MSKYDNANYGRDGAVDRPTASEPTVEWEIVAMWRPEGNTQDTAKTAVEKTHDAMRARVSDWRTRYGSYPRFEIAVDQIERANGVIVRRIDLASAKKSRSGSFTNPLSTLRGEGGSTK